MLGDAMRQVDPSGHWALILVSSPLEPEPEPTESQSQGLTLGVKRGVDISNIMAVLCHSLSSRIQRL
jgi:hypothetical protein